VSNHLERDDRHDPLKGNDYISHQHLERYRFAQKLLSPGMKVLDIACGTGYGSAMLHQKGCEVIGADLDRALIKEAKNKWRNNHFQTADVLDLPFDNDQFDALVSFETIEHVVDGDRFLLEMSRVLKPGGLFICSTPNITYTAHPEYHLKEYRPDDFFRLVEGRFGHIEKYGQYFRPRDRALDLLKRNAPERLTRLLEAIGIKNRLKNLLSGAKSLAENAPTKPNLERMVGSDYYKVCPYEGNRLLRIMITVARKGEQL